MAHRKPGQCYLLYQRKSPKNHQNGAEWVFSSQLNLTTHGLLMQINQLVLSLIMYCSVSRKSK